MREKTGVKRDYLRPGHDVDNFKAIARVAIEFQINSQNFKATKKINTVKAYLFRLLGVYLVDELSKEAVLTLKKRRRGDNKWIITPPCIKKTCANINPLE